MIEGLARGGVDVVIGTHRLLSKDVTFKNLGLLVIDEEHRFGVSRQASASRPCAPRWTCSRSPPRRSRDAEHGASGVRDLSRIETPPLDRLPVETVDAFSRGVIKDAIDRELGRGGQVFFVHNRIQSLASMTTFIKGVS